MGEHSRRESRDERDRRLSAVDRELRAAEGRDPDGTLGCLTLVSAGVLLGLLFVAGLWCYRIVGMWWWVLL